MDGVRARFDALLEETATTGDRRGQLDALTYLGQERGGKGETITLLAIR